MFVFKYYRRGLWFECVAGSDQEALDQLRAEKGSVWLDWQLASKVQLTWDTLPKAV